MSLIHYRWHISSFSTSASCVQVREDDDGIYVRHSKQPDGPTLRFNRREWLAFLAGVRNNEFELTNPCRFPDSAANYQDAPPLHRQLADEVAQDA